MKKTWLKASLLLPALMVFQSFAQGNVLITEYVEGSGNNKAIEVSNLGGSSVDMSTYTLTVKANANTTPTGTYSFSGSLDAGASFVIYNNSAAAEFKPANGVADGIASHNGDDSYELLNGGTIVDSIGQAGNDDNYSANETLRRKVSITTGDVDPSDVWTSADWVSFPSDTADGLGCPGEEACTGSPGGSASVLITEIVNGTGSNKVIEISNVSADAIDLAEGRYKLQVYIDEAGDTDPDWPDEEVYLQGNLPAGASLVVYNSGAGANFQKAAPTGLTGRDVTTFTGNDAIVLLAGEFQTVIDSFGQAGATSTIISDTQTLRRLETVTAGNTNITDTFDADQANEWASEMQDTFDGLGCPGESACVGSEPVATAGTAIDIGECFNCEDITPVFDIADYDPAIYYANTLAAGTSSKTAFVQALNQDISAGHRQLTYGQVWTALTYTDEDPNDSDNVILLYTGRSIFKQQNASGAAQGNNQEYWNREHTWAKSRGFPSESQLGYTDIHHLRPSQVSVNSSRGNLDFAVGGDFIGGTTNKRVSNLSWEPRDEVKGDVARMMFYMAIRYEIGETGMPDLGLVDKAGDNDFNDGDDQAVFGKLCDLYEWHKTDPVSDSEIFRNNRVHEYQNNRNPFIDYPEWVEVAFRNTCEFEFPPISFDDQIDVEPSTIIISETQTVTGFTGTKSISILNGEYSLGCDGNFTSLAGTISPDTDVCVRHESAESYYISSDSSASVVKTILTVSDSEFTFTSRTSLDPASPENEAPAAQTPEPFSFAVKENVALNQLVTSANAIITGLQSSSDITIRGGEYSIGCSGEFTSETGSLNNGDYICVRHTSSSEFNTTTTTTVKIGGVQGQFITTTRSESFVEVEPVVEQDKDDSDAVGSMSYWLLLLSGLLTLHRRAKNKYLKD